MAQDNLSQDSLINPPTVPRNVIGNRDNPSALDVHDIPADTPFPGLTQLPSERDTYGQYLQWEASQTATGDTNANAPGPETQRAQSVIDTVNNYLEDLFQSGFQGAQRDATPQQRLEGVLAALSGPTGGGAIARAPTGALGTFIGQRGGRGYLGRGMIENQQRILSPGEASAYQFPHNVFDTIAESTRQGATDTEIVRGINEAISAVDAPMNVGDHQIRISDMFGGVSRGADGEWRLELSDASTSISHSVEDRFNDLRPGQSVSRRNLMNGLRLPDVLQDSPLFDMYDSLNNIRVKIHKGEEGKPYGGVFHWDSNGDPLIEVTASTPEDLRSALHHEIQHAIQDMEGWAGGTAHIGYISPARNATPEQLDAWRNNGIIPRLSQGDISGAREMINKLPPWLRDKAEEDIMDAARTYIWTKYGGPDENWVFNSPFNGSTLEDLSAFMRQRPGLFDTESMLQMSRGADFAIYQRAAGEVESRVVQNRLSLEGPDLRSVPFDVPLDSSEHVLGYVPPSEQTIVPRNGWTPQEATVLKEGEKVTGMVVRVPKPGTTTGETVNISGPSITQIRNKIAERFNISREQAYEMIRRQNSIDPRAIGLTTNQGRTLNTPSGQARITPPNETISPGPQPPKERVTMDNATGLINELGLEIRNIRNTGDSTYISFGVPGQQYLTSRAAPVIRIPRDGHRGTYRGDWEQGNVFDTGWQGAGRRNQNTAIQENYPELSQLREALIQRFRPEQRQQTVPIDDPNQYRLFGDK